MSINILALPAASLLAAMLTLTGCAGSESAATVVEEADSPVEVADDNEGDETTEEEATDEESDEPADATAQLGDLVAVGDWNVKVTKVDTGAFAAIKKANQFNERPKGTYVLVTFEATYDGEERTADTWSDLSWSATTTDQQIYDEASVVTPAEDEEWPSEARKGGTVEQQVAFDLPADMITGGLLTVETYDAEFNEVYADFAL